MDANDSMQAHGDWCHLLQTSSLWDRVPPLICPLFAQSTPGEKADACVLVSRGFCNRATPSLFEMEFWDPELSYGNFENAHEVPETPTF